jgi:UDP-glucose 4-epimerase
MTTFAWIIGARGLLGSAVSRRLGYRPGWEQLDAEPLPWTRPELLAEQASTTMERLLSMAANRGGQWAVLWLAGSAVTAAQQRQLDEELDQLRLVLGAIGSRLEHAQPRGAIFFASSAGGVYGGALDPPFTEFTEPAPIAPYGRFKLDAEHVVREFAGRAGIPSLIGRIANLYGPGQRLEKMQGLISHLARAQISPEPASIFVPLDTLRDYLYVDDAADLIRDCMDELLRTGGEVTKIIASGTAVTIGDLLGHIRAIAKAHPHIRIGQSSAAALQSTDLRLRSEVWPHLDRRELTPLPAGIHATMLSVLAGRLS